MFDRMKDAAQKGMAERRLRGVLREAGVDGGASLSFRVTEDRLRATIVLAENCVITSDKAVNLESRLNAVEGLAGVTLVQTGHGAKTAPAPPPSAAGGHDNPLHLPRRGDTPPPSFKPARPERQRPDGVARVLAVASGKGGVGKSTVAARLALALSAQGQRVGILDLDIYGPSLPVLFGIGDETPEVEDGKLLPIKAAGLELMSIGFLVGEEKSLAWRGPMVMGAAKQLLTEVQWGPLDWLIIDTPPGTGDAHLTLLQRTIIDGTVLVSLPNPMSLADVVRGAALFRKMNIPILGLVENMATLPDGSRPFGDSLATAVADQADLPVIATLPLNPAWAVPIGRTAPAPLPEFASLATLIAGKIDALDPERGAQ
ncbi:P-loop NTPase [Parvularcula sp. LCG005]|uniref:P-loop NTPase n=1 Tax=Parvularcula sp. LCG005 TaxID=3078805 RepID=UPI0029420285|nr:P-loop NTPase [Parvularcula sp. LCG005]WOI52281.1 P-loop NTPase [Parvularcula sp. LCG005]